MRRLVVFATSARVLGGSLVACMAHLAHAEPSPADIASARRLFAESAELRTAGNWSLAAAKLREAIAIKETAGLHFHLAHCEEKVGHLVVAQREYDRAEELIRGGASAPDVATLLAPARAELAERVPSLLVKIPPDVPGARLTIDGSDVETAAIGTKLSLDPGSHTVAASAEGRAPFNLEVRLTEGEDRVVEVTLAAPPPASVPASPPTTRRRADARVDSSSPSFFGGREIVLLSEGALSLGGAAVGIVFLVRRGEAGDRADGARRSIDALDGIGGTCAPPSTQAAGYCSALNDALDARQRDGVIATIGFIGSGAGAAAMAVTWLLWPRGRPGHGLLLVPLPGGALVRSVF